MNQVAPDMPVFCLALDQKIGDWSQVTVLKFDKFLVPGQKVEWVDVLAALVPDTLVSCQNADVPVGRPNCVRYGESQGHHPAVISLGQKANDGWKEVTRA